VGSSGFQHKVYICIIIFIFSLISSAPFAQDNSSEFGGAISSVAPLADGSLAVSVNTESAGKLFIVSPITCTTVRRFTLDAPLKAIAADINDIGAIWAAVGNSLKKISILDGKELAAIEAAPNEPLRAILQSGEHILAWSDNSLILLSNSKTPSIIWSISSKNISDLLVDQTDGSIYTASFDGDLEKVSFQGRRLNSFSLDYPIYAISEGADGVFLAVGDGVIRYNPDKSIFTRISTLAAMNVEISKNGDYLHVDGGGRYSVFSYPAMRAIYSDNTDGKSLLLPNGSALNFSKDSIKFYNIKQRREVGRIVILNDAVGFISPSLDYFGNELFRQAVANGLISGINSYLLKDKPPNAKEACSGFSGILTAASKPTPPSTVQTAAVKAPQAAQTPQTPQPPQTPAPPRSNAPNVSSASTDSDPQVSLPLPTPPPAAEPAPPAPLFEKIPTPVFAPGSAIPDWVMRPADLPEFSAVKSGKSAADALKESRVKIRDDVARAVMKNMLEIEIVKNLPTDEVKKRFLWMVGGRTAQLAAEYVVQSDLWLSKDNIYYVLGYISTETVNQIYDPIFQEEMNLLNTYGNIGYLNRTPLKWE
jgi:hypothetical protein